MNFGTLVIVDGTNQPSQAESAPGTRGMVWMDGALAPPPFPAHAPKGVTFVVSLNYSEQAYSLTGGMKRPSVGVVANYSQTFKRLASGGNPLKDAKNFVTQFAGCAEAHKLRKRVIALARMRKSISGESFRFPLEAP